MNVGATVGPTARRTPTSGLKVHEPWPELLVQPSPRLFGALQEESMYQAWEFKTLLERVFTPRTILGKPALRGTRAVFPRLLFLEPSLEF